MNRKKLFDTLLKLQRNGAYSQAIRNHQSEVEGLPQSTPDEVKTKVKALCILAGIYTKRGTEDHRGSDFDAAIQLYDKALTIDEKNEVARTGKAQAFAALGDDPKAFKLIEELLTENPENSSVLAAKAQILRKLNRHKEAIEIYEQKREVALKHCETPEQERKANTSAYTSIAFTYLDMDDQENALTYFLKALAIDSKYVTALNGAGKIYLEKLDYGKAAPLFEIALSIRPKDMDALAGYSQIPPAYRNSLSFSQRAQLISAGPHLGS